MSNPNSKNSLEIISTLIETVHRLRAPNGCPWDRAQTHQSLRPYLIEEAHEVLEVLDKIDSPQDLKKTEINGAFQEELGDLLMQVLLHAELANETGAFSFTDIAKLLNEKLIRRHPHVFGSESITEADKVQSAFSIWERQKAEEKKKKAIAAGTEIPSVLDGLPKSLPALQQAERTIEKVSKVGFQWKDLKGPLAKLREEMDELEKEIDSKLQNSNKIEAELGDVLFSLVNVATFLGIHPEDALRKTVSRFSTRFRYVEKRMHETGKEWKSTTLEEMDIFWNEAKRLEN